MTVCNRIHVRWRCWWCCQWLTAVSEGKQMLANVNWFNHSTAAIAAVARTEKCQTSVHTVTDLAEFFCEQQVKLVVLFQLVKDVTHLTRPTNRRQEIDLSAHSDTVTDSRHKPTRTQPERSQLNKSTTNQCLQQVHMTALHKGTNEVWLLSERQTDRHLFNWQVSWQYQKG